MSGSNERSFAPTSGTNQVPRIAICVVTFNSALLVADLVDSLPAGAAGTTWTLVIADNASQDDTMQEVARHAPQARVVQNVHNRGYAAGVNAAVSAAGEQDAYLILNPDVRLHPGCVATLWAALRPAVGIVVPRLFDADGRQIWSMRREPTASRAWTDALIGAERAGKTKWGEVVTTPSLYESGCFTDWAEGSTLFITAECLNSCGPWDESFFLYSEETEFALRARDTGFSVWYEPTASATHLGGESVDSPRLWSLLMCNRVALFCRGRHGGKGGCRWLVGCIAFWSAIVAREMSRALMGRTTSRAAIRDLLKPHRLRQPRNPEWLDRVRA